jgi:anti-sigma B factor antagonist
MEKVLNGEGSANQLGEGLKACVDAGRAVLFAPRKLTLRDGSADLLRGVVQTLGEAGFVDITLDLSGCQYVDSAGLRELVTAFTFCRQKKGSFSLNSLPKKIYDLLQITRLYTVFSHSNVDYSSHPTFELYPQDISALKAARGT